MEGTARRDARLRDPPDDLPFQALRVDPTLAAEIMALFAEMPERGTSVLVVSHDLALLRAMRKRVLILDHGKLIDDISPQDLAE